MDIDDILASVSRNATGLLPDQPKRDLQALTRAWVNEKGAPELLPWPEELMGRVLKRIREQVGHCFASPWL
jgi:GINS complex subunit 4